MRRFIVFITMKLDSECGTYLIERIGLELTCFFYDYQHTAWIQKNSWKLRSWWPLLRVGQNRNAGQKRTISVSGLGGGIGTGGDNERCKIATYLLADL